MTNIPNSTHFKLKTILICIGTTIGVLGVKSANADSIMYMCKKSDEICNCAAKKLKADVSNEDYILYEAVGNDYKANKSNGMDRGDAWDAAIKVESNKQGLSFTDTLNRANSIGKAHRKTIKFCSG